MFYELHFEMQKVNDLIKIIKLIIPFINEHTSGFHIMKE